MEFFTRTKKIPIDLEEVNMRQIMNFPTKKKALLEGFYLKEIMHKNHIQIGVKGSKKYSGGIHDFYYDNEAKQINIYSRYPKKAFLLYTYLLMPLIFIFGKNESSTTLKLIGITIMAFIGFSLILILGIKAESKTIEREMVIRIIFFRRHGRCIG